ncbi:hypothetical protein ACFSL6_19685 [Paenibacillus thailandensis]|uniref:Uncharacterized protein n=1 Tax=Paenibacillus thailandensis TaxID=393250 RepID=A0ABW5QTX6_9BACL
MGKDLIIAGDALEQGIGVMTPERWSELQEQPLEIGELKEKQDVSKAFTTEYFTSN